MNRDAILNTSPKTPNYAIKGELGVVRVTRRVKAYRVFRFVSNLLVGLALGGGASECFTWLRTASWSGPLVGGVLRTLHLKLPHSNWPGAAIVLDWLLDLPFSLASLAALVSCAALFRAIAFLCLPPLPAPLSTPEKLPSDPRVAEVEAIYRRLDAGITAASKRQEDGGV